MLQRYKEGMALLSPSITNADLETVTQTARETVLNQSHPSAAVGGQTTNREGETEREGRNGR